MIVPSPAVASLFLSYAREDEATARAIASHLERLEDGGIARTWFDRDLGPGDSWEPRIEEELGSADLILVLVSQEFLAPGFAHDRELGLIKAAGARGARVVPVVLDDCAWQEDPALAKWQAFAGGEVVRRPGTVTFGRQVERLLEDVRNLLGAEGDSQQRWRQEPEAGRTDSSGLAFKGSQLQTQLYVNARVSALGSSIRSSGLVLPQGAELDWRSPLKQEAYAEYRDAEFLRALGLAPQAPALKAFWPARGPRWDALAIVADPARPNWRGVLLAEGKSYPGEMRSSTRAEGTSRQMIAKALAKTQSALGVTPNPEAWLDGFYQLANRLAHLVWLRERGVEAWLVHLLFVDDPHRPTSEEEWATAMAATHAELGVPDQHPWVGEVALPALARELLETP